MYNFDFYRLIEGQRVKKKTGKMAEANRGGI